MNTNVLRVTTSAANLRWLWLSLAVIVVDQVTKHWMLAAFRPGEDLPLTPFASLVLAFNTGAAFSFLGMGAQPPSSDWGLMISDARPYLEQAPWLALAPGLALSLTVIGINLLGDGLRIVLDPRLETRRSH